MIEYGAEAGKIVNVGIVGAGAEAEAETEAGVTTEVPAVRGGTTNTDTAAVGAKSMKRDTARVAAEAEKGAAKVPGREAAVLPTKGDLKALKM